MPQLIVILFFAGIPFSSAKIFSTSFRNLSANNRAFNTESEVKDFNRVGFNDSASSVMVLSKRWEVCSDIRFGGQCMVLSPGRYPSLAAIGMNNRLSSVRPLDSIERLDDRSRPPETPPVYDSRRRNQERLFNARVTSARAVVGPVEKRCWVERENVPRTQGEVNLGGAVAGALIGGILGHQVGGGAGKDIATVGGAVAGAALGANVGRDVNNQPVAQRDVKRCVDQPAVSRPAFWDVSYSFRGQQHRVQTSYEPGDSITVNANGEPRSD